MSFLDSIGLISDAISLVSFFTGNLPASHPKGTSVQVKAGEYNTLTGAGGGIKAAFGFDNQNQYIGKSLGASVAQGGTVSLTIDQGTPSIQGDYVDVTFTNDAVCVAWISVRMHDGTPGGAWTGDIGRHCGATWYHNSQSAGNKKNGSPYRPACTWFDGDHTNNIKYGGMKFRTRAYGTGSKNTITNKHVCASTIFTTGNSVVYGKPAKRDAALVNKRADDRQEWVKNTVISSNIPELTAKELCDSATSYGSDFLDASGMFCDMNTKTLHPTCSLNNIIGCVELQGLTLSQNVTHTLQPQGLKTYSTKTVWDDDE